MHSLSAQGITGGSEVPAYDRCYILATDIYVVVFRAVCIGIYYAMPIATPEAASGVNRLWNFVAQFTEENEFLEK